MTPPLPHNYQDLIQTIHHKACDLRQDTYYDPFTQEEVFTKLYLTERGFCCQQTCRHCPYENLNYNITIRYKNGD